MSGLSDLNLIHFFNFYLWLFFLIGTYRRFGQYRSILALLRSIPGRWPKLLQLVRQHGTLFLTWSTVLPGLLALALSLVQTLVSTFVWPEAGRPPEGLTVARLFQHWPAVAAVVLSGVPMLGVDLYFTIVVGEVDQPMLEEYFDQAEFWLRSWTAPVVRAFSLGFINPRKMVDVEVRKSLIEASRLLNATFWWVSLQVGLRLLYGLALWLSFALTRS